MEDYTFLTFIFVIAIGILFIGSGVTGLYSMDINQVEYCNSKNDCNYGKICCGFKEGDQVFRVCAKDCRNVRTLSQGVNYNEPTANGFILYITGEDVQEVKRSSDYWIYILIGVILVLLAFFYRRNPKQFFIKKKVKKRKR